MNQPAPQQTPAFAATDSVVALFEKLGVCIAIAGGAAAIVHFRAKVLPFCPAIAAIYGLILLFGALFLALLVGASWFAQQTAGRKNNLFVYLLAAVVTITTVMFFMAGVYAAIAALSA
jgi:hypothetical protein